MKLTREEILKLDGQPLVDAVATHPKIMNWDVNDPRDYIMIEAWHPLTDANDLSEVRSKMIKRKWFFRVECCLGTWTVEFSKTDFELECDICQRYKQYDFKGYAEDSSYSKALLRAALLAVNEEAE